MSFFFALDLISQNFELLLKQPTFLLKLLLFSGQFLDSLREFSELILE